MGPKDQNLRIGILSERLFGLRLLPPAGPSEGAGERSNHPEVPMRTVSVRTYKAKIEENSKEDPASEPDKDRNTWLLVAKFAEDVPNWETAQLDLLPAEIGAELVECSFSGPDTFTARTHSQSPLRKGDVIHVNVRGE